MKILDKALILAGSMFLTGALAHDHEHPELNSWYPTLHSKGGSPCCDGSDFDEGSATRLTDADWESHDGHYRVRIEGQWVDVPGDTIVEGPNRDGRPIVWFYYTSAMGGPVTPVVRCFIPGGGF